MCPSYQDCEADASVRSVRSLSSRVQACRRRKLTTRSKRFRSFLSLRDGKPNNTKSRPELLLGGQPTPLDEGVGTVSVVTLPTTGGSETSADVQFIHDQPAAGHSQQPLFLDQPEAETTGILQLTAPLLNTPEPVQSSFIQPKTCGQPAGIEIGDGHPEPAWVSPIPTLALFAGPT